MTGTSARVVLSRRGPGTVDLQSAAWASEMRDATGLASRAGFQDGAASSVGRG